MYKLYAKNDKLPGILNIKTKLHIHLQIYKILNGNSRDKIG